MAPHRLRPRNLGRDGARPYPNFWGLRPYDWRCVIAAPFQEALAESLPSVIMDKCTPKHALHLIASPLIKR